MFIKEHISLIGLILGAISICFGAGMGFNEFTNYHHEKEQQYKIDSLRTEIKKCCPVT